MNPIRLKFPDGSDADCWQCGECKLFYSSKTDDSAARCCVCQRCGKSTYGGPCDARRSVCKECWQPHHAEVDAKRLETAIELPSYNGPVVIAGDRYFENMDAMIDELDEAELPEFVHTCHVRHYQVAPDNIYEMMPSAAAAAIAAFNAANRGAGASTYWEPDYKHKVRVPAAPAKE